jgi:saccharopine dehydrogenase-like NADP-dependent oxidoreductase
MTGRQLELAPDFESAGLLALLGMGSAPGKTNLMAARAVRELGGNVESIDVAAAGRDPRPPKGFSVPYSLQTLLDELKMRPVVLRDGRPAEIEPLDAAGTVDFGEPIGQADTIYTLHSELRTFGGSFGCREASFKLSLAPELIERLRGLCDASAERMVRVAAEAQPPSPLTCSVHLVEAIGGGRRARVRCLTEPMPEWKLGGGIVSTAAPAAAAVRMLARGEVDVRGVVPPEAALDPDSVFAELESRGCHFELEVGPLARASEVSAA